ncbi:millepora cytotoxin-1-like isoform X3 [Ostrea edulis]|uniref:millepora cytotoxin-1-like isoform X3 n=1 Tax=Ostrea edulis TaxID=37623 RepID=UPI0024AFD209|nr:millepora cytotoxin-1-like isoform X3 [Ostrea edulis]
MKRTTVTAIIFPLVLLLEGCISYWSWVNDYDQTFHFQCPKDQYLTGLESVFSKSHNDRKFNLRCTPSSSLLHSSCAWTDYVNVMDEPLVFQCPAGGIVNGIGSSHDDAYEDRKFEFRCCNISRTGGLILRCVPSAMIAVIVLLHHPPQPPPQQQQGNITFSR